MRAYIGLGSNLGGRRGHLRAGLAGLGQAGARVTVRSSVWESEPVDAPAGSPWFLNMVVGVETEAAPLELLDVLLRLERGRGRRRLGRNEPRTLDLDLLLHGDSRLVHPRLTLPHPRMWERRFVLAPLAEIAPGLRNPHSGRSVAEELALRSDRSRVRSLGSLPLPEAKLYNPALPQRA